MGIRRRGNTTQRERGAALVEMAVLAPLLVVLLFGIWQVARAYNIKNTMDHAVREGARYAATIEPWNGASSEADVRALIDAELAAAAIPVADVTTGCIEKIDQGNDGCNVAGSDLVTGAPTDQIAVNLQMPNYELGFIFFSVDVDFQSQAISRWEG